MVSFLKNFPYLKQFSFLKLSQLSFLLFLLTLSPLTAQSPNEDPAYTTARRAFQDGLYDVAEQKLQLFLKKSPQSTEAKILLGQIKYFQGGYEEALAIFEKEANTKDTSPTTILSLFCKSETLAALGRWPEALSAYEEFLTKYPQDEKAVKARLGYSQSLIQVGKADDGLKLLHELQALGFKDPVAQQATILQARILLSEKKLSEARTLLTQLIAQKLKPPLSFEALYWLGQIYLEEKQASKALDSFKKITEDKQSSPRQLVAQTKLGQARALKLQKEKTAALSAYEQAITITQNKTFFDTTIQEFLKYHSQNKSLSEGAVRLREITTQQTTERPAVLFRLAEAFHVDGNDDASMAEVDNLLHQFSKSPWAIDATLLKSNLLEAKGNHAAVIDMLKTLASQNTNTPRSSEIWQQLAETLFANSQYNEAATIYQNIAKNNPHHATLEKILFNGALSFARAEQLPELNQTEQLLKQSFPKSPLLDDLALEKSHLLEKLGKGEDARTVLRELLSQDPPSPKAPEARMTLGMQFFRDAQYPEAAHEFAQIEKEPNLAVPAEFYRIIAETRSGALSLEKATIQYSNLIKKNPSHPLTPLILLQMAQNYYEQQNFSKAQETFESFSSKYPEHDLAHAAIYYAGRSLMGLSKYEDAVTMFEKLKENSSLKPDARLAEVDCYRLLGNFEAALKIADSLTIPEFQKQQFWLEAMLRRANCLYTMAAKTPGLYQDALKTSETILEQTSHAQMAQLNEAGFIKGKCLEKLNRSQEALLAYLDVVYGKLLPQAKETSQEPEYRWLIQCGVEAAQMKEQVGDAREAIAIYRILERLGGPSREEFSKKIIDLRSRYFILGES